MNAIIFALLVCCWSAAWPWVAGQHHGSCEEITIPMCRRIGYNYTSFPNQFHHDTQDEAGLEVHQFWPLVEIQCSDDLRFFLCSMYAPICIEDYKGRLPACRSVCERARQGCEPVMRQYGFAWPERMNCQDLPVFGDPQRLCMDAKEGASPAFHPGPVLHPGPALVSPGLPPHLPQPSSSMLPPTSGKPARRPPPLNLTPLTKNNKNISRDVGFSCPKQLRTPPGSDYVLRIGGKEYKNCGVPCHDVLFSRDEQKRIRAWTGLWALLCVISTFFTVLTFLIDTSRFRYPERPIIILSFCNLCIGLVYMAGSYEQVGDQVACNDPFVNTEDSTIRMVATITQGNKKETCTLMFMALYFFTMSSAVWWVILTLTWFLAACLGWGHEAIENNAQYFHLFGWGLPLLSTITVLVMGKVEGDVLSGVCFVGIFNQNAMWYFVSLPLLGCLVIGFLLLVVGFGSLWNTRSMIKMGGTNACTKTERLERLMLRIGVFSFFYICPTCVLLACYYYEHVNIDSWMIAWLDTVCKDRRDWGLLCPPPAALISPTTGQLVSRPYLMAFLIKYLVTLLAGITGGCYCWSHKSWVAWRRFLCCRRRPATPYKPHHQGPTPTPSHHSSAYSRSFV